MGEKSLVIDTYGCPIGKLAGFVETVIRTEWERFATILGISKKNQVTYKKNYENNAYQNYEDLIIHLLKAWKKQEGTGATLRKLVQLLDAYWGSEKMEVVKAVVEEATPAPAPVQTSRYPAKRKREEEHQMGPGSRALERSTTEDFDFWNVEPKHDAVAEGTSILINELEQRRYEREVLTVRVTYVSSLLPKCVFHCKVMDEQKAEMKLIAFDGTARKLQRWLKVNGLYTICKFKAEPDECRFSSRSRNGQILQITVGDSSHVQSVTADCDNIPPIPFNFTRLDKISSVKVQDRIDVIAIVIRVHDLEETAGTKHRRLVLIDHSRKQVVFNMWGRPALELNKADCEFKVVAIRNAEISRGSGRLELATTSFSPETLVWFKPDLQDGQKLHQWFQENQPQIQNNIHPQI